MKTKTINEKNNPVLKRKEITVEIIHEKGGTPDRITVRDFLASQLKENPENLYIINLDGKTGSDSSVCQAEIYENKELAEKILPQYLITRNLPPDKREVKQKAKAKPEETKKEKPETKEEPKVKPEETKKEKPEKTTISEKAKAKK
jgi:ribosomal protein S24E